MRSPNSKKKVFIEQFRYFSLPDPKQSFQIAYCFHFAYHGAAFHLAHKMVSTFWQQVLQTLKFHFPGKIVKEKNVNI